jgi:chromosome partitioning protein
MSSTKILALSALKGGVGKTVASVNIAGAMANFFPNVKVIIIDLDPQGNASRYLGYTPDKIEIGTNELLGEEETLLEDVICKTNIKNLYIVPSEISLVNIQFQLYGNEINKPSFILKNKLEKYRENSTTNTIIILDTQPGFDIYTMNALMCADRVICPVEPCEFSIHGFNLLLNNVNTIREKFNRKIRVAGIFKSNWSKQNTVTVKRIEEEYLSVFEKYMLETTIPSSIDMEKSILEKVPLVYSSVKNSKLSNAYKDLTEEIIKNWDNIIR